MNEYIHYKLEYVPKPFFNMAQGIVLVAQYLT